MISKEDVDKYLEEIEKSEEHMARNYIKLAKNVLDSSLKEKFRSLEHDEYAHIKQLQELKICLVKNWEEK